MRSIRYFTEFKDKLRAIVPDEYAMNELDIAIRFLVDSDPYAGRSTEIGLPCPWFAIPIKRSKGNPELTIYYVFSDKDIVFTDVVAIPCEEQLDTDT
jgi:hypothetical protein